MMKDLLAKICDPTNEHRDLYVDELGDFVDGKNISESEQEIIVNVLFDLFDGTDDWAFRESIFNLAGKIFYNEIAVNKIIDESTKRINELTPGCLVHAISIIADSNYPDKYDLLRPFLVSKNLAISNLVKRLLHS